MNLFQEQISLKLVKLFCIPMLNWFVSPLNIDDSNIQFMGFR